MSDEPAPTRNPRPAPRDGSGAEPVPENAPPRAKAPKPEVTARSRTVVADPVAQPRRTSASRRPAPAAADAQLDGAAIDYADVPGLSNEARAKLEAARPRTVGQAGRLDGLTPAALGILAAYLRREARRKASRASA